MSKRSSKNAKPLTMDTSVDMGNSEEYELHTADPDPNGSIQTLITKLFDKSMKDITDMISADRSDSNKLLQYAEKKVNDIEHTIDGIHSSLHRQSSTMEQRWSIWYMKINNYVPGLNWLMGDVTGAEKVLDDVRDERIQSYVRSMKDNLKYLHVGYYMYIDR